MKRRRRGARDIATAAVVVLAAAVIAVWLQVGNTRTLAGGMRVADGDTIVIDGDRVRLRGIDAPELGQTCLAQDGATIACGRLAARHLDTLIGGDSVTCRGHEHDRFERLLAVCSIGGEAGDVDLNRQMVADGWALAYGAHNRAEAQARRQRLGMWAWSFDRPADWRRMQAERAGVSQSFVGLGAIVRRARGLVGLGGHHE